MFIKTFSQISKKDVNFAGGKGASLGEMTKAGFLVPPGFVILAQAFDQFLEQTDLNVEIETILKKVNHKNLGSVEKASEKIHGLILRAGMPKGLQKKILTAHKKLKAPLAAVRSSATAEDSKVASWAGELETYLNVKEQKLINKVLECWASLFTPRAIFYRFEKNMRKVKISVAVVVQKMIQSEVSGVCFTVHPVTKDLNQMVIEAGFGLGEAIVGGQITPDTYVVHKNKLSILDINVSKQTFKIIKGSGGNINKKLAGSLGNKQKLKHQNIISLAKICKKIESHYKKPQDIEWAFTKGKFYILQSRPITTL